MAKRTEPLVEIEALQDRLSRLSEASLRINESLDLDTVLQGALDSARSLTRARYGVITLANYETVGGVLFSGMTEQEAQGFRDLPDGLRFLEYLNTITRPLRVPDLVDHFTAMGLTGFRPPIEVASRMAFLVAPLRHKGERVGNIYVGEKEEGGEFTREDEETLVTFASQAALVLTNARTHREERQARADLETLVNTSPVGVVVFDGRTGAPVSFNREALRLVDGLREPDQSIEQLLEVLTFRRDDGREISLKEFSMVELLSIGETVRAEEMVFHVPDGRSVTILVNATPILSEEREVESFVITLQDMTPMEELERLRADFLAMVSHELRGPLTSIKGSVATLLSAASELDPAEMTQFFRIIDQQVDQMRYLIGDLLDVARIETGTLSVQPGPADVVDMVDESRNRFLTDAGRDNVLIDLEPDLPSVMADRRRIVQVLGNLLTNAAMYSPPSSPIRVTAGRQGLHVAISVADEGRGCQRTVFRACLASGPVGVKGKGRRARLAPAWDLPSARGSLRRTEAASGRRAPGRAWGPASRSRSLRSTKSGRVRHRVFPEFRPVGAKTTKNRCASSPLTTTLKPSGTSVTRSRRRGTCLSSPATRKRCSGS